MAVIKWQPSALVALAATTLLAAVPALAQCPDGTPPPCAGQRAPAPAPNSVAVLYFDNLSRDSADAYLADGLTEQLIVRLGRIERLDVKPRSEVQRARLRSFGGPTAVARALNVRYLVTGSVRKVGWRVIVTAELAQPGARRNRVWGDIFDRSSTDVLDVETSIAEAVASTVAGRLRPEERAALARRPTRDARAYDFFQQANAYFNRGLEEGEAEADLRSAVAFYRAAIERDSAFVAAWAGLADAWGYLGTYSPPRLIRTEASRAAARALALDSSSGEMLAVNAFWADWGGHPGAAEAALRRAARTAPHSARPWVYLAWLTEEQGRFDEAIAAADSAWARDSSYAPTAWVVVCVRIDGRRWGELAAWEPRLRSVSPVIATYARSYPALLRGRPLEALRAYREMPHLDLNAVVEALVAADSLQEARALADSVRSVAETRIRDTGWYDDPDGLAASYALLGDKDEAFRWLERAYDWANTDLLLRLKVYAPFDNLRDDSRYHDLLRRLHLEP